MIHSHLDLKTRLGVLRLVANETSLVAVLWENDAPSRVRLPKSEEWSSHPVLRETALQLQEYLAGKRTRFELPLEPAGTPFQKKVWRALQTIGFGKTASYSEIARKVGSPRACRAVGAANRRNPISIVVPCHRVIGAGGALTGFAGGLETKAWLLKFEGDQKNRSPSA
jgi:methylated-DNA-[protein]-cysteine S-methyltransferase